MRILKALLIMTLLAAPLSGLLVAGAAEKPGPQEITAAMSCGVCGMRPARFPVWQTQIIFTDGSMVPFDGSKDMFRYLLNLDRFNPGKSRADVAAIWVKERFSNKWIDGESAYYVVGSSVRGPMGKDLVPFADADEAAGLRAENGGTVMPFADITMQVIDTLGMRMGGM
jgi:nitrous oxide reductase accessory protein NosL